MLVVDLLHEFELGVWKTLFTHLIRLLHAASRGSDDLVIELDKRKVVNHRNSTSLKPTLLSRYREISTFGHGTIRNFAANIRNEKTGRP